MVNSLTVHEFVANIPTVSKCPLFYISDHHLTRRKADEIFLDKYSDDVQIEKEINYR